MEGEGIFGYQCHREGAIHSRAIAVLRISSRGDLSWFLAYVHKRDRSPRSGLGRYSMACIET